jgi:hypothetical protein
MPSGGGGTVIISQPVTGQTIEADVGAALATSNRRKIFISLRAVREPFAFTGTYRGRAFEASVPAGEFSADVVRRNRLRGVQWRFLDESKPKGRLTAPYLQAVSVSGDKVSILVDFDFGSPFERYEVPLSAFEVSRCTEFGGFRRELVYSGVSGSAVRLTYREFSDGVARPAFTEDLSYDLSAGKEIGYKGARLRILKADNTGIRYELQRPLE